MSVISFPLCPVVVVFCSVLSTIDKSGASLPCGGGVLPAVMSLFVGGFAMLEALFI